MSTEATPANRLANAASPYLKSAAHQPVDWHPWGAEAFRKAREEDKPILLDVGAAWCHWCHVMDHESYEDASIGRLINERFVPVKVDRDERPDVDARYQKLVGAITGMGGWPLTGFLTPDGDVFYGGTYFPPTDVQGRPSFRRVLEAVSEAYRTKKDEVLRQAAGLSEEIARRTAPPAPATDDVTEDALAAATRAMTSEFDPVNGGFGDAPKFPHPSALAFLTRRAARDPGDATLRNVVLTTLERMARGGMRDHVGGGFHRYSVDAEWIVPHFEKMLYDNAELLRSYVHAWQAFREDWLADVAHDTARFMRDVLADGRGGFRGSQDADVGAHDDGDYFTWTLDELNAAVPEKAFARVLALRYGVDEQGDMHHNPAKNVLHVAADTDDIASATGKSVDEVRQILDEGMDMLSAARAQRETPFVDPTVYVNWNGMAASALLQYAAAFGDADARDLALRAIDRAIAEAYVEGTGFAHTLGPDALTGHLDDNAQMLQALLDAFDATGEPDYVYLARDVADLVLAEFREGDHFLTLAPRLHNADGAPIQPERAVTDNPSPSAAGVTLLSLLRLARVTGDEKYERAAREGLRAARPEAERYGLFAAQVMLAADALVHPGAHVLVAAHGEDQRALRAAALAAYDPAKTVVGVNPEDPDAPAPEEAFALIQGGIAPAAVVCVGTRCLPPAASPDDLGKRLQEAVRSP